MKVTSDVVTYLPTTMRVRSALRRSCSGLQAVLRSEAVGVVVVGEVVGVVVVGEVAGEVVR